MPESPKSIGPNPIIQFNHVSVTRNEVPVLQNIFWRVMRGEHWFILGPNGSGKTTLSDLVLGYLWASLGSVEVLGEAYGKVDIRKTRQRIGWVSPYLQDWMSGRFKVQQVVATGQKGTVGLYEELKASELKKIEQQLHWLGLSLFSERRFDQLSAGEQIKVLIARALIKNPKIILLDEPTSHLDFGMRRKFGSTIDFVAQKKGPPTFILITHHLENIGPAFTHGLLLKEGKIVFQGRKEEVLTDENLSRTFDVPLRIKKIEERYFSL